MSRILIFSRTLVYRHESIPHAAQVLTELAAADGHATDHTEDPAVFTAEGLRDYRLVVWLSTSGEVLDGDQREAFAGWLAAGGGWAGIHSATACEYTWPEYERIAGAILDSHPEPQTATVTVADPTHPSTHGLLSPWVHTDEWYNFRRHPPAHRTVLLTVDENSYSGGNMGPHHPIAWCGPYHKGRTWYTSLGHATQAYDTPWLQAHLRGGLRSLLDDAAAPGSK